MALKNNEGDPVHETEGIVCNVWANEYATEGFPSYFRFNQCN